MRYETSMTVKGQITVPKDVRELLGLRPGQKVGIETDPDGTVRIVKGGPAPQVTKEEFKHRLDRARELYKPLPEFAGMSGLEYQRWIRPDRIDI
jgi:AbrB family looped-hinge helix DNA binding protein